MTPFFRDSAAHIVRQGFLTQFWNKQPLKFFLTRGIHRRAPCTDAYTHTHSHTHTNTHKHLCVVRSWWDRQLWYENVTVDRVRVLVTRSLSQRVTQHDLLKHM